MVTVKIVPKEDYAVLMRYLDEDGVVLLSEAVLETFIPEVQERFREIEDTPIDYSFGGEPDIYVDVIRGEHGYAYQMLAGDEEDDND